MAARLGMTRAELGARMTHAEFRAWQAWLAVETGLHNDLTDKQQESITFKFL